jgi:nucleoid-associated protein YgaU
MNRYASTPTIKDANGLTRRATTILPVIPTTANDTYIVTTSPERLDKLANTFYGDTTLWWVIAAANGIGKGTFIVPSNQSLRIPAPANFNDTITQLNTTR